MKNIPESERENKSTTSKVCRYLMNEKMHFINCKKISLSFSLDKKKRAATICNINEISNKNSQACTIGRR